jgi:UDP-glucose 4-epimerase
LKVLVTGANGFLGRHVVAELSRRGHAVRAMVRASARVEQLRWPGAIEIVRGDLRAHRDWGAVFAGVDCVVHLAALVVGDEDAQFASTVVGTERFLAGMAASGVSRLVFCSSFSVYDWSGVRRELTEASPLERDLYERDGYAVAKVWQERVVRRFADTNGWRLTVLRPGFIWGRGNAHLAGIGQDLGPVHLVVGGPWRRMPLTHVENCAHCFATAVEHPRAIGETFNVVDGHDLGVWRYAGEYLRRSGVGGIRVLVPYRLWYGLTRLAQFSSRRMFRGKGKLPGILVPCKFEARFKPLRFPNAKLRDLLDWRPPLSFEQCIEHTYATAEPSPAPQAAAAAAPAVALAIEPGQAA